METKLQLLTPALNPGIMVTEKCPSQKGSGYDDHSTPNPSMAPKIVKNTVRRNHRFDSLVVAINPMDLL